MVSPAGRQDKTPHPLLAGGRPRPGSRPSSNDRCGHSNGR